MRVSRESPPGACLPGSVVLQVDTARQIKERLCFVASSAGSKSSLGSASSNKPSDSGPADFELPDGTLIRLDQPCRTAPTEILFSTPSTSTTTTSSSQHQASNNLPSSHINNKYIDGEDPHPLHNQAAASPCRPPLARHGPRRHQRLYGWWWCAVYPYLWQTGGVSHITAKCIEMCDRDLQPDLLKNIVLAGASVILPGRSSGRLAPSRHHHSPCSTHMRRKED